VFPKLEEKIALKIDRKLIQIAQDLDTYRAPPYEFCNILICFSMIFLKKDLFEPCFLLFIKILNFSKNHNF
jgi:hypothetical protein